MQSVFDFLVKANTYYLATVEGDQPRVRPFGTVNIFEGKLYILGEKQKKVHMQIIANPKAEICAYDGKRWVRVETTLVEDNRPQAQESMLAAYKQLRHMYAVGDGKMTVYYMKDSTATFRTFGEDDAEPEVVTF